MIDDELRTLLSERAGEVPDNPSRVRDVHARIIGIRRRRTAGAAFALVLLAVAGLALGRLPGHPETLPPADPQIPAPPYMTDLGRVAFPGWRAADSGPQEFEGTDSKLLTTRPDVYVRSLLLVRCDQPGDLAVRNTADGASASVPCRTRVGDHYEGLLLQQPDQVHRLFRMGTGETNLRLRASSPGRWLFLPVVANTPDRLRDLDNNDPPIVPLVDGPRSPGGATVEVTIPAAPGGVDPAHGLFISVECVAGVRLTLSTPQGVLGQAVCDPARTFADQSDLLDGMTEVLVSQQRIDRLGYHRGDRISLTVRRSGRDTDQWRVLGVS